MGEASSPTVSPGSFRTRVGGAVLAGLAAAASYGLVESLFGGGAEVTLSPPARLCGVALVAALAFRLLSLPFGRRRGPEPPDEDAPLEDFRSRFLSAERRLQFLMDSVPAMVTYVDSDERYVAMNRGLREMFNTEATGDPRGRTIREVVGPEMYEQSQDLIRRVLAGENFRIQREYQIPGVGKGSYESFFIPDRDETTGRIAGFLMLAIDETDRLAAEAAVRASEAKFRELYSLIPHGILEIDRDGVIVLANPAADRLFRGGAGSLPGKTVQDFYPEGKRREMAGAVYRDLMERAPEPKPMHEKIRTLDGREIHARLDWNYRRDADGAVAGMVAVATDITSEIAAERALAESAMIYRDASALGGFGYWFRDIATGMITWSDEIYSMYGLNREEFSHKLTDFMELLHPEDRATVARHSQAALHDDAPVRFDFRLFRPVGDVRHFSAIAVCERDPEGHPTRMRGTVCDVTDLMEARRLIRTERDLHRRLIDIAPVIILVLDPLGRIMEINHHMETITGRALDDVRGRDWISTFVPHIDRGRHRRMLDELRAGGGDRESVHPILADDGSVRLIEWRFIALNSPEGANIGALGVGVDLTERVALEKAVLETAISEQNRISRDLHDGVGQQLTGLGMMAESVARRLEREASPHAGDVDRIREGIYGALAEVGDAVRDLSPYDLKSGGLASALRMLCDRIRERTGIPCEFEGAGDPGAIGEEQARHLLRIAQEAVNNAVRHSGGTKIGVRLDCGVEENELVIYDNGGGVPTSRIDSEQGAGPRGGHGLSTMRHRASVIGGVLQIESGESGGTFVRCILPGGTGGGSAGGNGNGIIS